MGTEESEFRSKLLLLPVGYNREARLVEQIAAAGVLSAVINNGSEDVPAPPSE